METAIRWSPTSTLSEQHFLIADVKDRFFKCCRVDKYDGKSFQHGTISTYNKVPGFRAFDWAPHDESLVAVGSWSGEVTVLHIDDSSSNVSLPAKRQRLCNAVAFNRTGLLAAGLEGIRNDFCLNIWDVNQRLPAVSSPGGGASKPYVEPYRKFASSEAISSIKFFTGQPEVFLAGIKGKGIRIYDLRENTGNPSLLFKTDPVFNIAIDPLDENYFACAGVLDDRTIQIWDCRSGASFSGAMMGSASDLNFQAEKPVLEYKEVFKPQKHNPKKFDGTGVMISTIWSLRYCKGKGGCLGALSSTGDFKVFETKHGYSPGGEQYTSDDYVNKGVPSSGVHSLLTKRTHHIENSFDDPQRGRPEKERVVAFDFTNLASSKGTPSLIVLRGDQTVEIVELEGAPSALAISSLGEMVVSRPYESISKLVELPSDGDDFPTASMQRFQPEKKGPIADFLANMHIDIKGKKTETGSKGQRMSSRELHEQQIQSSTRLTMEEALTVSTITRRRCNEGYLFDCQKNIDILQNDAWLQMVWHWIDRSKRMAEDEGMTTDALDLSFFGIASIWNNDLDSQRASNKVGRPTYSKEVAEAVATLCERLDLPELRIAGTGAANHRRLCLHTCGLGLRYEQLETLVRDLVQQDQNTKAAAVAVIHDQAKLAFLALRNGKTSPVHRELSLALAGYNKGTADETWEETVNDLLDQLDDPYARAILALVEYGDWHDVLAETSLPLRDRLGIALMYLDDEDLTQYIQDNMDECIKEGDLEGIVLTGLTEHAVPLFENYIRKFKDLQTAVLAMSITCPRYFADSRIDIWRQTYRSYLNGWGMFVQRSRFDVQASKFSTPPHGRPEARPPPRQISLRCNYCDQALDRNPANAPPSTTATIFGSHPERIFGGDKYGTACPRCGRHMPRCVICSDWLGMPSPYTRGSVAAGMTKESTMNKFVSVCRTCWHMSHGGHASEWFAKHRECPVPECACRCVEVGFGNG